VNAWVTGVALAVAVAALVELGARWWMRRRTGSYVWLPGLRIDMRPVPDAFPAVEPRVRVDINRDGERGGDVRREEPGLFRVLVAGGSAAECLALDQPTSWPGALERLLNLDTSRRLVGARRAHVGNIGRSGVGSYHLDLIFEHVLPQYEHLSVIVVMVGASDVLQWLEAGAPPSLEGLSASVPETFVWHREQVFGWVPSRWAALRLAGQRWRTWFRPVEVRERVGAWIPVARKMRAEAKELRTRAPDPTIMLDRFESHFRRLLERAQLHADRVLVARQPWLEKAYTAEEQAAFWHGGVGKAWKESITVYYAQSVLNELMGMLDARAAKVADELGVQHLDLRATLTPTLENYYDCFHCTAAGAAVVAQAVAAAVLGQPAPAEWDTQPGRAPRNGRRRSVSRTVRTEALAPASPRAVGEPRASPTEVM
jgi:lysophospholipase L1-like esterase